MFKSNGLESQVLRLSVDAPQLMSETEPVTCEKTDGGLGHMRVPQTRRTLRVEPHLGFIML